MLEHTNNLVQLNWR